MKLANLIAFAATTGFFMGTSEAVTIFDDFNDGNDTGWTKSSPFGVFGINTTATFPGGNTYRLTAGASPNAGTGGVGPSRGGSLRNDAPYTQFSAVTDVLDWSLGGGTDVVVGMLARISDVGLGSTDGYGFFYDAAGAITIARITNEAATALPGAVAAVSLTSGTGYRFAFQGDGGSFTAQVYELSNLAVPLATLNATDATYASGVNGLFVYDASPSPANHTPSATFDNYASIVPEPTSGLMILAAAGLTLRRRRA